MVITISIVGGTPVTNGDNHWLMSRSPGSMDQVCKENSIYQSTLESSWVLSGWQQMAAQEGQMWHIGGYIGLYITGLWLFSSWAQRVWFEMCVSSQNRAKNDPFQMVDHSQGHYPLGPSSRTSGKWADGNKTSLAISRHCITNQTSSTHQCQSLHCQCIQLLFAHNGCLLLPCT